MLSIHRCREVLGMNCTLTDVEVEQLREQLYGIASVALDALSQAALATGNPEHSLTGHRSASGTTQRTVVAIGTIA